MWLQRVFIEEGGFHTEDCLLWIHPWSGFSLYSYIFTCKWVILLRHQSTSLKLKISTHCPRLSQVLGLDRTDFIGSVFYFLLYLLIFLSQYLCFQLFFILYRKIYLRDLLTRRNWSFKFWWRFWLFLWTFLSPIRWKLQWLALVFQALFPAFMTAVFEAKYFIKYPSRNGH